LAEQIGEGYLQL